MASAVRDNFISFSTRFEGDVNFMYRDIKGLVTIRIGDLIDPAGAAVGLPFVHKGDQSPAPQAEIQSECDTVKARQDLKTVGHPRSRRSRT
jgi:hypothetical protein